MHDRVYETIYKNPNPSPVYEESYAGHYVRKDRPYKFGTFYQRVVIPRSYAGNRSYYIENANRHFRGVGTYYYNVPGFPKPQVQVRTRPPVGFDPYRNCGTYYHGAAPGTTYYTPMR
jgi:hypothetical protein